jgi:hypothetical protein
MRILKMNTLLMVILLLLSILMFDDGSSFSC